MEKKQKKVCCNCGRSFDWRHKWKYVWDEIKFCSKSCRRDKRDKERWKEKILVLLKERGAQKTICPSEVLAIKDKSNKELMEEVRRAARLLYHEDKIIITQKNKEVDPDTFKGPIRLKLKKSFY